MVVRPGPLSTVQDLGRPGYAGIGVSTSGAADRGGLSMANALVGNPTDAAGVEMTFGGLRLRLTGACNSVSVAGAGAPLPVRVIGVDGGKTERPWGAPFLLAAGEQVDCGRPTSGLRSYLAVAGGIDAPKTLGSRATDTLSGLGPEPLSTGTQLWIGMDLPRRWNSKRPAQPDVKPGGYLSTAVLRIRLGPRDDWFSPAAVQTLLAQEWTVTPDCNRIGMKLGGAAITRERVGELPSEGVLPGAIQIPPTGLPIIFLADHPVTGGYPVIGVVLRADIDMAAQIRPGGKLRFRLG